VTGRRAGDFETIARHAALPEPRQLASPVRTFVQKTNINKHADRRSSANGTPLQENFGVF
jgi:hypothetical protein